jgi:hypothetical protein
MKHKKHVLQHKSKRTTRKIRKTQSAGGFFSTSNKERILNNLLDKKAINKDQKKQILKATVGDNKTDKINAFVNKCVEILSTNIHNAWNQVPGDIKSTPGLANINKLFNTQYQLTTTTQSLEFMNKLVNAFDNLSESDRIHFSTDGLDKVILPTGQNGGMAFQSMYQLYISWIKPNAIATLPDPKFADLHFIWFKKRIKSFFEKHWLLLWLTL